MTDKEKDEGNYKIATAAAVVASHAKIAFDNAWRAHEAAGNTLAYARAGGNPALIEKAEILLREAERLLQAARVGDDSIFSLYKNALIYPPAIDEQKSPEAA